MTSGKLRPISFRTKIVALVLAVEALVLGALVWHGSVLELQRVDRNFQSGLAQLRPLLNAAVEMPIRNRDIATLQHILDDSVYVKGTRYLVAKDREGNVLAAAGIKGDALPHLDAAMEDGFSDKRYDTVFPLSLRGEPIGSMHIGVSLEREMKSLDDSLRENLYRSGTAFAISILLFLAIIQPFARRLGRLQRAADRVAAGDYAVQIEDPDTDEVGALSRAFSNMTGVVRSRVAELEKSRQQFHAIADYTYDVECWMSPEGKLLWINSSVQRLTGYAAAECLAAEQFPWFPVFGEDLVRVHVEYQRALKQQTTATGFEFRIVRKDGEVEWISNSWQPIYGGGQPPTGTGSHEAEFLGLRLSYNSIQRLKNVELDLRQTLSQLKDVNALQSATAGDLRAEQSRLLSLLSAMSFGVVFVDRGQRIVYANPAFAEVWSIPATEPLLGLNLFYVFKHADDMALEQETFTKRLEDLMSDHKATTTTEIRLASGRLLKLQVCPVLDEEHQFQGSVLIHEDITQAREAQNQLSFLAERDPLTGLYNRRRFERELAERLETAGRSHERVAVFFFDLDEFKSVNDLFGHRMGDQVLLQVAGEIRAQLRRSEFFARIGGDEFALVVNSADDDQIRSLAERLMRVIGGLSVQLGEVRLSLTSSLGIAISPDHSRDPLELIAHADAAMYQAKDAGKNTWRVYQADHAATLRQRSLVTWNDRIRHALRHDGFELHLQGVFDTNSLERRYAEALLRMPDESSGRLLPPSQFIPYAEKSNLIIDIDRWTLNAAIDLLANDAAMAPIAVNLSGRSVNEPSIAEFIALQLVERNVDPARLFIEITETAAISDMRDAQRFIERLHAVGCKVALDDFGAGFATFAYIKQLPVDVLKIDGLFIRNLGKSRDNQVFVRAMLDIARGFDKLTVAEAVEDETCLDILRSYGVDMVQGYALERPTPTNKRPTRPPAPLPAVDAEPAPIPDRRAS
jgi:diguanylate cyclase (GGDEF)-like protein/PAS domain S-box-containing protein